MIKFNIVNDVFLSGALTRIKHSNVNDNIFLINFDVPFLLQVK